MNRALVDQIAKALLYEGYLLYPYRASVKNRQRWTFGGLYPPEYVAAQKGSDLSAMQTQCLVQGAPGTVLTASVRFLQLVARRVGAFEAPLHRWREEDGFPRYHTVESLRVGDQLVSSWQEAVEREIPMGEVDLDDLVTRPRWVEFDFAPGCTFEPIRGAGATVVGVIEREHRRIDGGADLSAERVGEGLYRLTARIENRTHLGSVTDDRDRALLQALVSTHTILGVAQGEFVSLLDPPEPLRSLAAACTNVGTWPVLVGAPGEADTMLSSPIIVYDYPEIAPESPGDLFDATEIDEILTLRILTLTDNEKRAVSALDGRGKALLERTEALAREQLMGLHGTFRGLQPVNDSGRPHHE
jgi:hydrogenase maturation protease